MTTTNKGLIQPANGSYVDTWDQPVNNDWSYIDTAFGGAVSLNATGISAHTLTLTEYRPLIIEVTGAISNNVVYTIPSGIGGQWIVINNTTDATGGPWTISFTCAGSGYSISCPRATTTNLMCDGVNVNFADGRPGSPGGSNTQVQYNNNGTLAGSSNFVFTGTNVGIGTSSPAGKLDILTGTNRGFFDDSAGSLFRLNSVNAANSVYAPLGLNGSVLTFEINATERARIDSSGNLLVGTTGAVNAEKFNVTGSVSNFINRVINSNAGPYGHLVSYSTASPNGSSNAFYYAVDSTALRFAVGSNGGISNYSANNVNLSDQRVKKNIQLAGSYLNKICAIPVKTFLYNDQTDEELNLGVIAQDVDAVAPELIDHSGWKDKDGEATDYLSIYQTDLQYALMKCIQELSAKVAALEANATKVA